MSPRDSAVAFRRRLIDADDRFADGVDRVMRGLRQRSPGVEPSALARHQWVTEIPTFGSLSGPVVAMKRGQLALSETRAGAARFSLPVWHRGPDDDPLAEKEAAVALVTAQLGVAPKALRFNVWPKALVSLDAVAGWFAALGRAAGGESVAAALPAELAALAASLGGPDWTGGHLSPGAISVPAPAGGCWVGEVVEAPRRPGWVGGAAGAPGPIVAMLSRFDA